MEQDSIRDVFNRVFTGIDQAREAFAPQLNPLEVGTVTSVGTGVAKVSGLPGAGFDVRLLADAPDLGAVLEPPGRTVVSGGEHPLLLYHDCSNVAP